MVTIPSWRLRTSAVPLTRTTAWVAVWVSDSGRRAYTATTAAIPAAPRISTALVLRIPRQNTAIGVRSTATPTRLRAPSHRTRCQQASHSRTTEAASTTSRPSRVALGGSLPRVAAHPTTG